METWTKLYQRILQSSVWKLPSDMRVVWITLLALKDENGCVFGTEGWLADQARVDDKVCSKAIKTFLSPDTRSRTANNEGRKIEEVEGGWRVLNHHLYRDGIEDQREKWRRQKANQRAKELEDFGDKDTDESKAGRIRSNSEKIAREEAIEAKVREKFNLGANSEPDRRADEAGLSAGEIVKKRMSEDPITKADKAAMRKKGVSDERQTNQGTGTTGE